MVTPSSSNVTQLLLAWGNGDKKALNELMPLVYDELYRLAARQMKGEKRGHTLQTTALVHEAYCKLVDVKSVQWQNRAQFFAIAAQIMRRILINHAKFRARAKRGGDSLSIEFDDSAFLSDSRSAELISLDDALTQLANHDALKGRIVEMKFFAGLNIEEIAHVERVSISTIEREWRKAKVWLRDAMQQ
jgi:RNA polymerase sigma-70 factor (ECF subfamily)